MCHYSGRRYMSGEATAEATIAPEKRWHRIEGADLPGEGRGSSVAVDGRTGAVSQWADRFGLANRRPDLAGRLVNPDWPEFARLRGARGLSARSVALPDDSVARVVLDSRLRPAARRSGRRARVTSSPDHR